MLIICYNGGNTEFFLYDCFFYWHTLHITGDEAQKSKCPENG